MDSGRSSPVNLSRSGSLRVTSNSFNRTSLVRRNQSMSAKQIRFYRNGDRFFHGLKLAVSSERYKEFDSLLAELSEKLNLSSGAVRFIFNAEDSSMITDITQLQYGVPYVCSSTNSFRTIEGGYGKNLNSWSIIPKPKNIYKPTVLGNIENYHIINNLRNENGREFIKPKLVTVIRNGKPPQKKVTLLLNSKTAISLDQVLDQLSAKGSLGKVDKLFTVDGRMVKVLRDLFDDDTVFIAMSTNEKFPEDGIELDPNSYRITPYRELKRPSNMSVRRSNSLRHSMSHYKNDENLSISRLAKNMRPKNMMGNLKGNMSKVPRPRSGIVKHVDQTEELYPTSVFETDSSESDCEYEIYSMFGIKRDRTSVHSIYKIGRIIGDGNFAIVRECRNRKTQKTFALKVINKAKVKGKEHMIENEILILRKISHPNIVKLHEEFETPKEIYLVMELVSGGDLFDAIVANTRFSEPDSAYMVRDLASAVQYLHDMDIVHRDIKPENLLVVNRADGRKSIKLADFGLSIEVKSPMFLVCGTPTYVAPEILDESGYGIKVDVWAIGVICYILLCGFPPFRSANHDQEELFDKILHGDFEYLSPFWDDVSEGPRDLIDRLLVVDASERYEASEILTHPWVKKWTEPVEKIHRELSEAEEADKQNRKRLRGIAIAIHSVISLLRYVRAKRKHIDCESSKSTNPNSLSLTETKLNSRTTPNISRIPRPKPSAGLHIAEIRKSITTPIKRRKASKSNSYIPSALKTTGNGPAPDYSLKKGFLKREEAIQRAFIRMNCAQSPTKKIAAKTILTESPGPTRRNSKSQGVTEKHVKFRPASSVLELRQSKEKLNATNRPSSAQSLRSLSKKSANVVKTTSKTLKSSVSKPEISKSGTKQKASASIDKSSKPSVSTSDLRGGTPTNGVRLRQKTARPRPRSMIETKVTSKSIDEFLQIHDLAPVAEHQATKVSRSDSIKSTHSESPTEQLKKSARKPRPTSLVIKNNPTATSKSRPKAMTPNSTSSNSDTVRRSFQSLECLSVDENILNASFESTDKRACSPRRKSRNDSLATQDPMFFGKFSTTRTSSPASKVPVSMVGQTKKVSTPTRKDSSPQRCHSASRSRNHSSSTPVTKGGTHTRRKSVSDSTPWNPSTRTGTPTSPKRLSDKKYKRSLSEQSKSIKITAEINKRKNIKFPDGKTVDKEVKTTTTFSLDMPDSEEERTNQSSSSLLTKVKNLAHEIENLSKDNCRLSDSSSDSITNNTVTVSKPRTSHDNNDRDVINEETDRFSETEYLSVFGKAGSELNS